MVGMAMPFLPGGGQNSLFGHQLFGYGYQGSALSSMQDQMFSRSHFEAVKNAASTRDVDVGMQMTGLAMQMAGREFSPTGQNYSAARKAMERVAQFGAYVDPATVDTVYGGRSGSVLTSMAHLGGRQLADPVTGVKGLSGASAAVLGDQLWQQFYSTDRWREQTGGLTSYQMGSMFSELGARGMLPSRGGNAKAAVMAGLDVLINDPAAMAGGPGGGRAPEQLLRDAGIDLKSLPTDASGRRMMGAITDQQADKLRGMNDPALSHGIRVADSKRIGQTLKEYTGAVAAVAEIFGESGRPDAPMSELITALDKITGGGLARMSGGQLQRSVRQIHSAMREAKMDISAINTIGAAAGQATRAAGLDETFVGSILPSTMGAVAAYNNLGFGSTPAWGRLNQMEMMKFDVSSRAASAASPMANRLGAILRMNERLGGLGGAAGRMAKAIQEGTISADQMGMDEGSLITMLSQGSGVSADQWQRAFTATEANSEFVQKSKIMDLVASRGQARDFRNLVLGAESGAFARGASELVNRTIGANEGLSKLLSGAAADALMNIDDPAVRSDAVKRNAATTSSVVKQLRQAAAKGDQSAAKFLARFNGNPSGLNKEITAFVEGAYSEAGQEYKDATGLNIDAPYTALSPAMIREKELMEKRADARSTAMSEMTGLLSGSPMLKFFESLQKSASSGQTKPAEVFTDAIASAMGGKANKDVAATLGGMLADMQTRQNKYVEGTKSKEELDAMSAEERQHYDNKRSDTVKSIRGLQDRIKGYMNEHGLTQVLGDAAAQQQQSQSGDGDAAGNTGGGGASISLQVQTLNLNGAPVATNVRSDNTPASQGGRKIGAA